MKLDIGRCNQSLQCRKIPKTLSGIETADCEGTSQRLISRKIPKTLSGIETQFPALGINHHHAGKYLKPYQGLKRKSARANARRMRRKIPKTLSGIETNNTEPSLCRQYSGRKIPKTLSGIETDIVVDYIAKISAGKYLKPYQGLKRELSA